MYATVFKKDPLDPALGKLYRDKILLVGGSREETESLEVRRVFAVRTVAHVMEQDFLGRPPNSVAFLKEMFGEVPNASL